MSRISAMAQITFLELQTTVLGNFCPWIQNFSVHSVSYHRLAARHVRIACGAECLARRRHLNCLLGCLLRVKTANTRGEQMFSALPPRPDIVQCGPHVRFMPLPDSCSAQSLQWRALHACPSGSANRDLDVVEPSSGNVSRTCASERLNYDAMK